MTYQYDPNIEPERGGGFTLLPEGIYRFQVLSCDSKCWPSGDIYWNIQFGPIEPAGESKPIWHKLNFPSPVVSGHQDEAKQRLWAKRAYYDFSSLGVDMKTVKAGEDAGTIVGRTCTAKVMHKNCKDGVVRENIWEIDPDKGPGTVDKDATISMEDAETEVPF